MGWRWSYSNEAISTGESFLAFLIYYIYESEMVMNWLKWHVKTLFRFPRHIAISIVVMFFVENSSFVRKALVQCMEKAIVLILMVKISPKSAAQQVAKYHQ